MSFAVALLAGLASAQGPQVYLSEVCTDAGAGWIELHNRGTASAEIGNWCIYQATLTPGMSRNYWWPIPAGTVLPADGYLRIHWLRAAPATVATGELYTGTTTWHFLFGYFAEPLQGGSGALALLNTRDNNLMNSAGSFVDWVSWGTGGGYSREALAAAAGCWPQNAAAPALPAGSSLARSPSRIAVVAPPEQWLPDATPTPLAPNQQNAAVDVIGTPCTVPGHHLLGLPQLDNVGQPTLGNAAFALRLDNTTGLLFDYVAVAFSTGGGPVMPAALPPVTGGGCATYVDAGQVFLVTIVRANVMHTEVPVPLVGLPAALNGLQVYAQGIALELFTAAWPPYQGASNGLRITIGG